MNRCCISLLCECDLLLLQLLSPQLLRVAQTDKSDKGESRREEKFVDFRCSPFPNSLGFDWTMAEAVAVRGHDSGPRSEAGDSLERRSEDVGESSLESGGNQAADAVEDAETARERRAAKGKGRMQEQEPEQEFSMYPPESANDDEREEQRVANVRPFLHASSQRVTAGLELI